MIFFPILKPYKSRLFAVSTTRNGGVSEGNYSSMNLCGYVEDNSDSVMKNKQIFCDTYNIDPERVIFPYQTHSDNIININSAFLQQPKELRQSNLRDIDAIVTNINNVCIGVSTADCVPVLFYDKEKQAIGAAHAGWRGTVKRITAKTINLMAKSFETNPEDIIAVIAPCISKESYEVGDELYGIFNEAGFPIDLLFLKNPDTGKYHLDLRAANKWLLTESGVLPDNIYISDLCTFKNSDIVFSARKSGIKSGRMASCIMLK